LILIWTSNETEIVDVLLAGNTGAQAPGGMRRSESHSFNISIMVQNERWKLGDKIETRSGKLKIYISMPILILFLFYCYKDTDIHIQHLLTQLAICWQLRAFSTTHPCSGSHTYLPEVRPWR